MKLEVWETMALHDHPSNTQLYLGVATLRKEVVRLCEAGNEVLLPSS